MKTEELTAKALEQSDIDRYQLALAVASRASELDAGSPSKLNVSLKNIKSSDLALMEIAEGLVQVKGFARKK
jgi:DNA-directed RNA polymerase subunit omega